MDKKKIKYTLYFWMFCSKLLLAQLPTPENMINTQAGQSKINHAYGMSSFSMPIHVLKEGDIEVPISINNLGNGVRVEDIATRTGLGMGMNAGGSITRIVRDKPDEGYRPEKPNSFSIGVIFGDIQVGITTTPLTSYMKASHIYNLAPAFVFMGGWLYNGKPQYDSTKANPSVFDHAPDIFVINIAGKTIRFLFDENHQIQVLNGEDVKIEYTFNHFSPYLQDDDGPQNLTVRGFVNWAVTLSDGVKYVFGEPHATIPNSSYQSTYYDYSYDFSLIDLGKDPFLLEYVTASLPSTWHLQKIISPVGSNTINFSYQSQYYNFHYLREYEQIHNPDECKYPQMVVSQMRNRLCGLKKIESSNFLIEFNSSEVFGLQSQINNFSTIIPDFTASRFIDTLRQDIGYYSSESRPSTALKNILIKDKATNAKKAFYLDSDYFITTSNLSDLPQQFTRNETYYWGATPSNISVTYNSFSGLTTGLTDYKRLRLKGIYEIYMESSNYKLLPGYSFEYSMAELPRRLSQARDHWGYYNGQHVNRVKTNLMPVSYNTTTACYNTSNREANSIFGVAGLLTRIFYPTGSQITYKYEPHEATNWGLPSTIGGFRVASITTDDCLTGIKKEVLYEYKQADNSSSGYMSLRPKYFFKHNTTLGANSIDYVVQSVGQYSYMVGNFLNGGYISYKRVIEKEIGKGYTEYLFHADETNIALTNNLNVFLDQIPVYDFKRGAVKQIIHYNESNQPLKSSEFFYTPDNLVKKKTIRGAYLMPIDAVAGRRKFNINIILGISSGGIGLSLNADFYREEIQSVKYYYDIPIGRFNLEKIIEKNYDQTGQNPVEVTNENFYESSHHNLLTRTKITHSNGDILEKVNRYAKDFDYASLFPIFGGTQYLNGQSIINLQNKFMNPLIEQYTKRNGKIVDGKVNEYYLTTPYHGLLNKEWILETENSLTDYVPVQYSKNLLTFEGDLGYSFKLDNRYVERSEYVSYNPKGFPTQLKEKNGSTTQMQYAYNDLLISGIRRGYGTPDENFVQYEYIPLFGTTKKILSNGYFENFSYDGAGRLKEIRDSGNNILKTYTYNYADIACFPNPMNVYGELLICSGRSTTLNTTGCIGTTKWYDSNNNLVGLNTTFTTPNLSSTVSYYVSCTIGTKESSKAAIKIFIDNSTNPNAPAISATYANVIYGSNTLSLAIPYGSSVSLNSNGCAGTTTWQGILINGQTGPVVTFTPFTDATYYATCTVGACISSSSNVFQIRTCSDANEPNEVYSQATNINIGESSTKCLTNGDSDFYKLTINSQNYYIKVVGFTSTHNGFYKLNTLISDNILSVETQQDPISIGQTDTKLYLYAPDGVTQLAYNDDFNGTLFSKVIYTLPVSTSNISWNNTIRTKECNSNSQVTLKIYVSGLVAGATAQFSTDGGFTWQNANVGNNGFSFTRTASNTNQTFQARASDFISNTISTTYNAGCSSINWGGNSCLNNNGDVTITVSVVGLATDSYAEFSIDGVNFYRANIGGNSYQVVVPYGSGGVQGFNARAADSPTQVINGFVGKCGGNPSNISWDNTRRTKLCNNGQTTMSVYVTGLTSPAIAQFSTDGGTSWNNANIGSDGYSFVVTSGNYNQTFKARATDVVSTSITMNYNAGCTTSINWSSNSCSNTGGNCAFFVSVTGLATDSYAEFSIDNTNWFKASVGSNGYNVTVPYGTGGLQGFNARPADNPLQAIGGLLTKCQ
jgi:YD repeat-containing protein